MDMIKYAEALAMGTPYKETAPVISFGQRLYTLLQPFAQDAEDWGAQPQDTYRPVYRENGENHEAAFTLGQLRALADLYWELEDTLSTKEARNT